jgi:hypothetical protein
MNQVNPHNMNEAELHAWAIELCKAWNWNADFLWIAHELRDTYAVKPDSREFDVVTEEFNKFFDNPTMPVIEAVKVSLGDIS